ncbi:hypothetical protein GCM10010508_19010 [Streptomyces naganishii JCM 4654]|uniref:Uncharacterized protein n=1 Tax=Streptomyces naganishii JCM 4654 TaxID=1306179 RepID=A0A918Y238_9ACTN|nr:hypothetical protein GCM10010508_19010 [Streptomyces naganishii JCM 4654]
MGEGRTRAAGGSGRPLAAGRRPPRCAGAGRAEQVVPGGAGDDDTLYAGRRADSGGAIQWTDPAERSSGPTRRTDPADRPGGPSRWARPSTAVGEDDPGEHAQVVGVRDQEDRGGSFEPGARAGAGGHESARAQLDAGPLDPPPLRLEGRPHQHVEAGGARRQPGG